MWGKRKSAIFRIFILSVTVFVSQNLEADMFGGDVVVLAQILSNALQQLQELKSVVQSGQDSLDLVRDLNQGINDSLNLIRSIDPNVDPGIYKDWDKVTDAVHKLETVYGVVVESRDAVVQKDTDQSVAEAVSFNNSVYKYTKQIDEISDAIKSQSHNVSPGGAAKLTAQSIGVLLNVQNEMLRTQATGLKLQAEAVAIQNRKDKERTAQMIQSADDLTAGLKRTSPKFQLPRFN